MSSDTYKLLDCGRFSKLEAVGPYTFERPSPQAIWEPSFTKEAWSEAQAKFVRTSDGQGYWKNFDKNLPEAWVIEVENIKMEMRQTGFGHLGIFVEQKDNWKEFRTLIKDKLTSTKKYRVLNLFAYTGGASIAAAQAGAEVVHIDASKTSNSWAKVNAHHNGLDDAPIRWITDDVKVFVEREIRRGNKYEAIILDPPTYGRGSKKQIWKVEEDLVPLLKNIKQLFSDEFHFISLSSHSQGYTPLALENLLAKLCSDFSGTLNSREMTITYKNGLLPAGTTCMFTNGGSPK